MMRKILEVSIAITMIVFIWFTILFDPTSTAIGLKFFTVPDFVKVVAEMFGNIIWIISLLFLAFSIIFIAMIVETDQIKEQVLESFEEKIKENDLNITQHTIVDKNGRLMFKPIKWYHRLLQTINIIGSLIAIGSGFWFTGSMWLLFIITGFILL